MTAPDSAVKALMDLGRRQGRVSTEDVRQLLPLNAMSAEEIANLILRLEERGIAVDVDPALFVPTGRGAATSAAPPLELPRSEAPKPPRAENRPDPPRAPPPAFSIGRSAGTRFPVWWVILATVIAIALLVAASFALR